MVVRRMWRRSGRLTVPAHQHVLRSRRLSGHTCAKLIWCYMAPILDEQEGRAIKVRVTARALGLNRSTVRRALSVLVDTQFLECVKATTKGTAGEYRFGEAVRESGAPRRAPTPPPATKTLIPQSFPND